MDSYDLLIIKNSINEQVLDLIKQQIPSNKSEVLYLALHTKGGNPDIGFRIMNLLDSLYKKIYVLVPDKAMSTGTLMALGSDKIFMGHSSSLGPLDLQIEHPTDGSWISTLDIRDTMKTLLSHTEVAAQRLYDQNYLTFGLGKTDAAKFANETAAALIKPVVDKIDPYHLHKSFRGSEVGAKYGSSLLKKRMMRDKDRMADLVSSHLANNYETHGYAIALSEATDLLMLNAEDLNKLELWPEIEKTYLRLDDGVSYTSKTPAKTNKTDKKSKE